MEDRKHSHSSSDLPQRGFIVFDDGDRDATIGCVVRYSSPTGANLEFDKDAVGEVPAEFSFHTSDWDDGKHCVVIWRMGTLIGVEYQRKAEPEA